jgi:hypothetical protein
MGDGWAWISLSAYSEAMMAEELALRMPDAKPGKRNRHLAAVEFGGGESDPPLEQLLRELGAYLDRHRGRLVALGADADFQLRIGWSPRSPQEALAISADLLAALGELKCPVMLDTYND